MIGEFSIKPLLRHCTELPCPVESSEEESESAREKTDDTNIRSEKEGGGNKNTGAPPDIPPIFLLFTHQYEAFLFRNAELKLRIANYRQIKAQFPPLFLQFCSLLE